MDAVRCYVNSQVKSSDKHMGILAGALRSAVNRHTGDTPNCLMQGREVNSPATLQFSPPPPQGNQIKMGGGGEVGTYVANLEKSLSESHE